MQAKKWVAGVWGVVWGVVGAAAVASSACSASPGSEESETASQALRACFPGTCSPAPSPPVVPCASERLWPFPQLVETPLACLQQRDAQLKQDWRALGSADFEVALLAAGCSYANIPPYTQQVRASLQEDVAPYGIEKFSLTVCPASCALNALVDSYVGKTNVDSKTGIDDGTPVDPYIATTSPTTCDPTLPAGYVYVEWDPRCPGGCPLPVQ